VDLGAAMNRVAAVIARIQEHDSPERFCKLGAEVAFGTPRFVDDHQVEIDGRRVSAQAWVIATGSRPALPPVEGLDTVPYWTNETVFSQRTLPARLLVLGGGPIGLEMAQAFQRLGSRVTVVEFLDQILASEDADLAEVIRKKLVSEGVQVLTRTSALRARRRNAAITLTVVSVNGGEPRELEADALLVATGRQPNVEGLSLEAAGVTYGPNGIPTDARMRTSRSHIYAAGDINGVLPFTNVAGYEGGIALTNAVLRLPRKANYKNVPWCTYTDPEVASVGLNEKRAIRAGLTYRVLEEHFAENDRALTEAEPLGKIKVLVSPKGAILGCQIAGAHAGELIHEWVAAIAGGVKLSTVAGAIHVYPTFAEISKRVAGNWFSAKLFSNRTRSLLHLLFGLRGRTCTTVAPPADRGTE
jgi:pyruvate/2-oxoglutarate dehydrogenase complex dihydrolipoamide dehydrogenase (E3) component